MTLLALADAQAPAFRRGFQYALARAVAAITDEALTEAFATGTPANALAAIPWLPFEAELVRNLEPAYKTVLIAAGKLDIRKAEPFGFNVTNPRVAQWILNHSGNLVRGVTEESKQAIRARVLEMFQRGLTPAEAAREIRQYIGLTQGSAQSLWTFQQGLQSQLQLEEITARQLVDRVTRRRAELLAHRANVIARTEALTAANQGQMESWRQALEAGYIDPDQRREWLVTPDERLCAICAPVPGRGPVLLTEAFILGDGSTLMAPPAHPQCRCTMRLVR